MQKLTALLLALFCVLSLVGCSWQEQQKTTESSIQTDNQTGSKLETVSPLISILDFSYAEDCAIYVEGEPGVKTSGFANTAETDIGFDNVIEVAQNECTIEWDSSAIYFDAAACIWKVVFFTEGMVEGDQTAYLNVGGDQTVYLDHRGKTVLIVYGE